MTPARRGFTLIEILVSIMIFSIVGMAMMAIMLMASEIYRQGEAGRSANDETISVMAALDDDLGRMLPADDGGWFFASMDSDGDGADNLSGDTLLAFVVRRRDRSQITGSGEGDRALVAWWLDGSDLRRAELAMKADTVGDDPTVDYVSNELWSGILSPAKRATWPIITGGCLHFGGIVSSAANERLLDQEWTKGAQIGAMLPDLSQPEYRTGPGLDDAFPEAIRINLVLTGGGRFGATGFLVDDIPASTPPGTPFSFRIAGVKAIPSAFGSMVRIDDEWIGYRYSNGRLDCTTASDPLVGRGQRRSDPRQHDARTKVFFGQTHALVRRLAQ